jgi:putative Mg2+ transporter-C (MgtC) family protein
MRSERHGAEVILETSDIAIRLAAAVASGVVIGVNRDLAHSQIGARTLGIVALGAATVVVAVIQVPGLAESADALSRVIQGAVQGVMAGISFIGAGVILRNPEKQKVEGLTTAAAVWVTAALGIACGLGSWITAGIGVALAVAVLGGLRFLDALFRR